MTPVTNPYLFTGRHWDTELGYYYFRNRYLDPVQGRFASRDQLGLWGDPLNLGNGYTYAGSNPWSLVDPFGLCSGNSFLGNFFSALVDWETYRDYGLYSYGQAALGVGDWAVDIGELAVHSARMRVDPFYARDVWLERYETAKAIASDPLAAYDAMGASLYEYLSDFDARDAGKLIPDFAGLFLGMAEARAAKTAAEAAEAAGDAARALRKAKSLVPDGPCFLLGTLVLTDGGFTPIEQLHVGQRVITTDTSDDLSATEVDPGTWRALDLLMEDPRAPGNLIELTILRSASWMIEYGVAAGSLIHFVLPEMGIDGIARVESVGPCPLIEEGPGNVILSTVRSMSGAVYELVVEGVAQPIEPTAAHPFFSLDREEWVPAAHLRPGEKIRTLRGSDRVVSIVPKPGLFQVFNLEVETAHQFVVSKGRVLTHNSAANPCAALLPPNRGNGGRGGGPDHAWVQQYIESKAGGAQEVRMDLGSSNNYRIVDNLDSRGTIHQVGDMRHRGGFRPSADQRGAIEDLRKAYPNSRIVFHDKMGQFPSLIDPDLQADWKPAPSKYRKW